jgi:hypothetical protein
MCGEFSFEHSVPVQTRLHLMLTAILQHGDLGNNVREVYLVRHDGWVVVNLGVNLWHEMATKEEKQPGQRFKNNVANLNWNPNPGKKGHESPSRDVKWICWSLRGDVTCVPWFSWRHVTCSNVGFTKWLAHWKHQFEVQCNAQLVVLQC